MPDRGVGRRDVVEAVQLLDGRAHRAAHDQLHDQLDPLGARLPHVLDVRHERQVVRVADQPVEERVVELGVDEPGARALQLVAHAAGAPDLDREVPGIALHRPADRLAQHVAAVPGRRRVLHHVHGQRDDPYRPLLGLPVDQRQRHGEAVVDVELVHQREVELVQDQRLREMRRQIRVPADDRHRARPVSLVGGRELVGTAERERGHELGRERGRVVVVDQDHHVRYLRGGPGLGPLVPGEQRLPVGLPGLAEVDRRADGRDVAGGESRGDARHLSSRPLSSASPRATARRRSSSADSRRSSCRSSWTPPAGS